MMFQITVLALACFSTVNAASDASDLTPLKKMRYRCLMKRWTSLVRQKVRQTSGAITQEEKKKLVRMCSAKSKPVLDRKHSALDILPTVWKRIDGRKFEHTQTGVTTLIRPRATIQDGLTIIKTAQDISRAIHVKDTKVEARECPWLVVHDKLYVSTSITGDESWGPLIQHLGATGEKKFTIFSGRHGYIPNGKDSDTGKTGYWDCDKNFEFSPAEVFAPHHMKEDLKRVVGVKDTSTLTDAKIYIYDTAKLGIWSVMCPEGHELSDDSDDCSECGKKLVDSVTGQTVTLKEGEDTDTTVEHKKYLKNAIQGELKKGHVVILAWCYSAFSFLEIDSKMVQKERENIQIAQCKKPLYEVIQDNFFGDNDVCPGEGNCSQWKRCAQQTIINDQEAIMSDPANTPEQIVAAKAIRDGAQEKIEHLLNKERLEWCEAVITDSKSTTEQKELAKLVKSAHSRRRLAKAQGIQFPERH